MPPLHQPTQLHHAKQGPAPLIPRNSRTQIPESSRCSQFHQSLFRFSSPEVVGVPIRPWARTARLCLFSRFLIPRTLPPSYSHVLDERAVFFGVRPGPAETGNKSTS